MTGLDPNIKAYYILHKICRTNGECFYMFVSSIIVKISLIFYEIFDKSLNFFTLLLQVAEYFDHTRVFDPKRINRWSDFWSAGITILVAAYGPLAILHSDSLKFLQYNGLTSAFFKWTDGHKEKLANASSAFLDLTCRLLVSLAHF